MVYAKDIIALMESLRNDEQREVLMRFFKTRPGQYGEGDEFLGLKVPQTRKIVKEYKSKVSIAEIESMLYSRWHEVRLCGLLLLVEDMKNARKDEVKMKQIAGFYLCHARRANNWDLVDLSCPHILGPYIMHSGRYDILYTLADSDNLWEQRIAIVSTIYFIRQGIYAPTLRLAEKLLKHTHDLIHKAIGWMLREVGKRDAEVLRDFLRMHCRNMARTTLRYSIERFSLEERKYWLKRE